MIIALSTDSETIIGSRYLSVLYKERIVQSSEFFDNTHDQDSLSSNPRLTFLSHSKTVTNSEGNLEVYFGGLSATEFVNRFTAAISIEQANHISQIDMIGCNIGHIDTEGHGFVIDVVKQLQERGYSIPIHTFMSPKHDYDSLSVNCCPINQNGINANIWRLLGLKTPNDSKVAAELTKKLRSIATKKHNLSEELKRLHVTPPPSRPMPTPTAQSTKNMARLMTMSSSPQHNPLFATERKNQILAEFKQLEILEVNTAIQLQSLYVIVCLTDNPRVLFNTSPEIYNANYRLTHTSRQASDIVARDTDSDEAGETDSESVH